MLALGATIVTNKRKIAADEFFKGMYETALGAGRDHHRGVVPGAEEGRVREVPEPGVALRAGRRVRRADRGRRVRVAVTGAASAGVPRDGAGGGAREELHAGGREGRRRSTPTGLNSDLHGSPEYRAHLIAVMAARAVAAMR